MEGPGTLIEGLGKAKPAEKDRLCEGKQKPGYNTGLLVAHFV